MGWVRGNSNLLRGEAKIQARRRVKERGLSGWSEAESGPEDLRAEQQARQAGQRGATPNLCAPGWKSLQPLLISEAQCKGADF